MLPLVLPAGPLASPIPNPLTSPSVSPLAHSFSAVGGHFAPVSLIIGVGVRPGDPGDTRGPWETNKFHKILENSNQISEFRKIPEF